MYLYFDHTTVSILLVDGGGGGNPNPALVSDVPIDNVIYKYLNCVDHGVITIPRVSVADNQGPYTICP